MTASASGSAKITAEEAELPPDRTLHWSRTDFVSRDRFPNNTSHMAKDPDGKVNWMRLIEPLEQTHVQWRRKVGTYLAKHVDKKKDVTGGYIMADLPAGYEFYDHNSGYDTRKLRHDPYLFGPANDGRKIWRFRSTNEFLPHAEWLYNNKKKNVSCLCKYCSGNQTQKEISAGLNAAALQALKDLPGSSRGKGLGGRGTRMSTGGTGAAASSSSVGPVRRARQVLHAKPVEPKRSAPRTSLVALAQRLPTPPKVLPSGRNGLHPLASADLSQARSYRKGEVIWVHLEEALSDAPNSDYMIEFWPGVITDIDVDLEVQKAHLKEKQGLDEGDKLAKGLADDQEREYKYQVRLFATPQTQTCPYERILPYHSYSITSEMSVRLGECKPAIGAVSPSLSELTSFRPLRKSTHDLVEQERTPTFSEGAGSYAVAVYTSERVGSFYRAAIHPDYDEDSYSDDSESVYASLEDKKSVKKLRKVSQYLPQEYQGLWWGTERIWVGDLVRIRESLTVIRSKLLKPDIPHTEGEAQNRPATFLQIATIEKRKHATDPSQTVLWLSGQVYGVVRNTDKKVDLRAATVDTTASTEANGDTNGEKAEVKGEEKLKLVDEDTNGHETRVLTVLDNPLPPPPPTCSWHALMPEYRFQMEDSMLAGRYYPHLLQHPCINFSWERIRKLVTNPVTRGEDSRTCGLLALAGLERGWLKLTDNKTLSASRSDMLEDAKEQARAAVWGWIEGSD